MKTGYLLSEYWENAYRAYSNTSFYPEKRADSIIKEFSEELTEDLQSLGENQGNYKEKYINHFTSWLSAQSRCLSAMITGPARFPVARNEKNLNSERNHWDNFRHWREKYFKAVNRERTKSPEEDLDLALADLDQLLSKQQLMKEVNKIIRANIKKGVEVTKQALLVAEFDVKLIEAVMEKDRFGGYGFASFQLTNNNAKIKARQQKVDTMRARIEAKESFKDIVFDGGKITIDEDDRVKVYHDEKPEYEIIQALKKRGFRWSCYWGCWSRKHTAQAIEDARVICTPGEVEKERAARIEKAKHEREKKESKIDVIMKKYGAFWAFGNKQFEEQRQEGVQYCQLYTGLICPVDNHKALAADLGLKLKKVS